MKIECVQDKLAEIIQKAEKVVGRNMALPVLSCLLLEAKGNTLSVRATNLELALHVETPVKVLKEGTVAVPGAIISSFVQHLRNEKNITLEFTDNNLKISTTHSSTLVKTVPFDDFPTFPKISGDISFSINPQDFIKGVKSVWGSASPNSIKPELSSISISCDGDVIVFVATDSFRLAEKKIKAKKTKAFENILIPYKNAQDIVKALDGVTSDVEIQAGDNHISFSVGDIYLISRVVDGVFPDYKQIIPEEFKTEVISLKDDVLGVLQATQLFSDKFNKLNVIVRPKDKICEFRTKNSDVGESTYSLEAACSGEPLDIGFNHKYLSDGLQTIDTDSVSISFGGLSKPAVIRGVGDQGFLYLVMPTNK